MHNELETLIYKWRIWNNATKTDQEIYDFCRGKYYCSTDKAERKALNVVDELLDELQAEEY